MNGWQRWLRQPQSVWLRRANFQVHLWAGIGLGIYVFVICVTGSALVFRPEMSRAMAGGQVLVAGSGTPVTDNQIREVIARTRPGYEVYTIYRGGKPNAGIIVVLTGPNNEEKRRMLNPFTGEDIGPSVPFGMRTLQWFLDLHDNLLGGETGRIVNGIGGALLTIVAVTGLVVWWPGIKNWQRSLMLHRGVNWKRFNWDLHSALGFWTFALTFIWAVSGAYLVFQGWIQDVIDYYAPIQGPYKPRLIDDILLWLQRLHFGRFRGLSPSLTLGLKITWVILGLAPAVLFVTGAIMWWNRVLVNLDWNRVWTPKKPQVPKETLNPDPS